MCKSEKLIRSPPVVLLTLKGVITSFACPPRQNLVIEGTISCFSPFTFFTISIQLKEESMIHISTSHRLLPYFFLLAQKVANNGPEILCQKLNIALGTATIGAK